MMDIINEICIAEADWIVTNLRKPKVIILPREKYKALLDYVRGRKECFCEEVGFTRSVDIHGAETYAYDGLDMVFS